MGGLVTSFNLIYFFHVKKITSKIKKNMMVQDRRIFFFKSLYMRNFL